MSNDINVYALNGPKRESVEIELKDPEFNPDTPAIKLVLRVMNEVDTMNADDEGRRYFQKHFAGMGDPESDEYIPPENLPPVNGEPIYLSETACMIAAGIEFAQVHGAERQHFSFKEVAVLLSVPAYYASLRKAWFKITPKKQSAEGNSVSKTGSPSSATSPKS